MISDREKRVLMQLIEENQTDIDLFLGYIGKPSIDSFTKGDYAKAIKAFEQKAKHK